jgi:hypothetical protein
MGGKPRRTSDLPGYVIGSPGWKLMQLQLDYRACEAAGGHEFRGTGFCDPWGWEELRCACGATTEYHPEHGDR